jgi:hypothetical protein
MFGVTSCAAVRIGLLPGVDALPAAGAKKPAQKGP